MRYRIPRGVGTIVFLGQVTTVHLGLPLELSRRGRRHGWRNGGRRPGRANLCGLAPLLAGTAILGWAVAGHYAGAADEGWAIGRGVEPEFLLTSGPYGHSRNPMYVGGVAIWTGWVLLFGSAPVAAGLVALTGIYRLGLVWEEKTLERRWGDRWRAYAKRTPRWLAPTVAARST
jgi:protein-S-isoprenylcysteine O-methyltransferase Ste14